MELHPGEPAAIDWQTLDAPTLRAEFTPHRLILVDGGSGSGKTTFADHAATLLGAPVVRTDDIAWHHHATDWDTELITHVIEPWRRGEPVRYRPPGWVTRNRAGAVTVSAGQLIIEGVGAARASLARLADLVIWVQTDRPLARERGIARDVELGRTPAEAERFWTEWMSAEDPFLTAEQPWRNAHLIVDGAGSTPSATRIADGPAAPVG
ncbi:uridine kinase family protein [Enemella evansiae]|uniref:uridine kinase family protein n=1 Tax=Enemella evansiae TaxID=2016499 RepID=UPI0010DD9716|nr:hypothetical protein [Enemella evansiae]TDO89761.1 uridine kinase [Enemella evansiae]